MGMIPGTVGMAPATISMADIYGPSYAEHSGTTATTEKVNPVEEVSSAVRQKVDAVSGFTGLPPVVVFLFLLVGLLGFGKIVSEKWH